MRRVTGIGRWHQPLLQAVWLAFGTLRAEVLLARGSPGAERGQHRSYEKHFSLMHDLARRSRKRGKQIGQQNTGHESNPAHFSVIRI
jgi:hypothetical protein